jgi:hypothetical protein
MIRPAPPDSEAFRDARAHAWQYVFECYRRNLSKEDPPATSRPEDAIKGSSLDPEVAVNRSAGT